MNIYEFLLLCMAFLLPLWRTGAYIISGLTTIAAFFYWFKNYRKTVPIPKNFQMATAFYLICVIIAILFSNNYKAGFYYFVIEYTIILFLPLLVRPLLQERSAYRMIFIFAVSMFISSLIIIYQGYGSIMNLRPNGLIGHMNYAGATVILIPAILAFICENENIEKKIVFLGYMIVIFAIIASVYNGTRAIFVDLGVVGFAYLLLFWKPKIKQLLIISLTIAILAFAAGTIKSSERVKDFNPNSMSIVTRLQMWEIGFAIWENNPLLGVGVGQCPNIDFTEQENGVWKTNLTTKKAWNDRAHLHNLIIQTMTETGMLGLVGMLSYWGYILTVFFKHARKQQNFFARAGFCGVLGFLCHGMTDYVYGITSETILISVIIALTFSQLKYVEKINN